jgi:hypothetical protein
MVSDFDSGWWSQEAGRGRACFLLLAFLHSNFEFDGQNEGVLDDVSVSPSTSLASFVSIGKHAVDAEIYVDEPMDDVCFRRLNNTHHPLPAADVPRDFLGHRTLPLRWRSRPHLHRPPRPRRRRFE